ncbi:MAG: polysaccharide deacetylase [Bacteroidales bacterium]|nr:polysaccharide deacetylase [Bacteroidales bacterium]
MNKAFLLIFLIFSNLTGQKTSPKPKQNLISHYQLHIGVVTVGDQKIISLREFMQGNKTFLLVANPENLKTSLVPEEQCTGFQQGMVSIDKTFPESVYVKALKTVQKHEISLQDAGITSTFPKENGIVLSVDLCPSEKPLEKGLFVALMTNFKQNKEPIPVSVSITGHWMLNHKEDLNWMKFLEKTHRFDITWVNHSYSHRYIRSLPLQLNFMLMKQTDVRSEVLKNEIMMLENGLTPSVFFRFPGLVSSKNLIDTISGFGLITIGSDAWLAKGQKPHHGSIVLIHGNGNEPYGIHKFMELLKSKQSKIKDNSWKLYGLGNSLEEYFKPAP